MYRIEGESIVTYDDYISERFFENAVAYALHEIAIHNRAGATRQAPAPGVLPTIPFSALIPRGSQRLLAAGRCIFSNRKANAALRV